MFNFCRSEYKVQVLPFVLILPLLDLRWMRWREFSFPSPGLVKNPSLWPLSLNNAGCSLFHLMGVVSAQAG